MEKRIAVFEKVKINNQFLLKFKQILQLVSSAFDILLCIGNYTAIPDAWIINYTKAYRVSSQLKGTAIIFPTAGKYHRSLPAGGSTYMNRTNGEEQWNETGDQG